LGYGGAEQIRIGKHVEVILNVADKAEAQRQTDEICKKLLANTVMEDYSFTLEQI
ncbi:MAG: phosphoribosylformylglycinamidine synthase subunit PurS, partial [Bacteroidetes bacterium]|nr:phosphoribosylformylglycinamidine synthase subunit PurS [Bacteroidota bacterium]